MRTAVLLLVLGACGRFGFDGVGHGGADARDSGGGDDGGDAADAAIDREDMIAAAPPGALFGSAVAISADGATLAVGSYGEAGDRGNVRVFARVGAAWQIEATMAGANTSTGDVFGYRLALSADGSTLVVGAPDEDGSATTVDGPDDDAAASSGAAYVFARSGGAWAQQAYLKAPNTEAGDNFGTSVAITAAGDLVAVGAWGEDGDGFGTTGALASNGALEAGAVYTFVRAGATWTQQTYLKASNTGAGDNFGLEVALAGDGSRLAVSAPAEASAAVGIGGDQSDNSLVQSGALYLFVRDGTSWQQEAYIKASNPDAGDFFGSSIALSADGGVLVASSEGEDGASTGVDGPQVEGAGEAGAAYVFARGGTTWTQAAYLKATNTGQDDRFGRRVGVSGDGATIVIGAAQEDSAQTGIGGTGADEGAHDAGAAYVYRHAAGVWAPLAYLKATDTTAGDGFGEGVAVDAGGARIVVGAPNHAGTGEVYVFD